MSEDQRETGLRDKLTDVVAGYDELVSKVTLMAIECECARRQNQILSEDNERMQGEIERMSAVNKKLLRENNRLIRILSNADNMISDGIREVKEARAAERPAVPGSPTRVDSGDSMPRIVRMGSETA